MRNAIEGKEITIYGFTIEKNKSKRSCTGVVASKARKTKQRL